MSKYKLPDFDSLKPQFIDQSIKKIIKSPLYRSNYIPEIDDERYKKAVEKLKKMKIQDRLTTRECKVLSHNITELWLLDLFDKYYIRLGSQFKSIRNQPYFILSFLNGLYNEFPKKDILYNKLRYLEKNMNEKRERYNEIRSLIRKSNSYSVFKKTIKKEFEMINNKDEIKILCEKYMIKYTDNIYGECVIEFIYGNYMDLSLWEFNTNSISSMELKLKKDIFRRILLDYKDILDIKKYSEDWFNFIYREIGDPYDTSNYKWDGIEDVMEIFRRWNIESNMEKFFEQIVGGDKRRKKFWRGYLDSIYRVDYFEDVEKSFVMDFKEHTFVEFAKSGNALYYYGNEEMDINKIKNNLRGSKLRRTGKLNFLKQGIYKIDHRGAWEDRFEYRIRALGYKMGRRI